MTPSQWFSIVNEVEALWGKSQRWRQADELVPRAQGISFDAAMRAVEDLLLEGAPTPAPAEILSRAHRADPISAATQQALANAHCHAVGHLWAWSHTRHEVILCARCGHDPHVDPADQQDYTEPDRDHGDDVPVQQTLDTKGVDTK